MATEILATGSTDATSSDVAVTTALTVALKGLSGDAPANVRIELYDGAAYQLVGALTSSSRAQVITGPGTYRFVRTTGTCGVFSG
jgi:hypothetical protein